MKLLVLGGGSSQVGMIKRAKELGHTVYVSDYLEDAPGKVEADEAFAVSTFDVAGCLDLARRLGVDGLVTVGTDQPVYTVASVAQELGLPSLISTDTALAVTNKRIMKKLFQERDIATARFTFLAENFRDAELAGLNSPLVIKPVDSQGQRGVYYLENSSEVRTYLPLTLSYSREKVVLLEEYYENGEITVSGWVEEGQAILISVTDRITFRSGASLGICNAHHFPSRYLVSHYEEIKNTTQQVVDGFSICNGPIYFQMLVGKEGVKVNEVSCRIGGAYEDQFIPALTGIDLLGLVLDGALGNKVELSKVREYDILANKKRGTVELVFAQPGYINKLADTEKIKTLPGVLEAKFNVKVGQQLPEIVNATQRVGYMIITGDGSILEQHVDQAYELYRMEDQTGSNMIIRFT